MKIWASFDEKLGGIRHRTNKFSVDTKPHFSILEEMTLLTWLPSCLPLSPKKESAFSSRFTIRQKQFSFCILKKKTTCCLSQSLHNASSAKLDWKNLGFSFLPTNCFVYSTYRNGSWSELETSKDFTIRIPIAATVLHYGQVLNLEAPC